MALLVDEKKTHNSTIEKSNDHPDIRDVASEKGKNI